MKNLSLSITLLSLALIVGCATVQPGSQFDEVKAEQTLAVSLAALDSFVSFEARNRSQLPVAVRDIAAKVRAEAPKALESAQRVRLAYKLNRSAANESGVMTALSVVDALVGEARVWIPAASASGRGNSHVNQLVLEAESSKTATTASPLVILLPMLIDLAKEVYGAVNAARTAAAQAAEWTPAQEVEFAARLASVRTTSYWL